jgi:hypothetical protein
MAFQQSVVPILCQARQARSAPCIEAQFEYHIRPNPRGTETASRMGVSAMYDFGFIPGSITQNNKFEKNYWKIRLPTEQKTAAIPTRRSTRFNSSGLMNLFRNPRNT